MRLEFIVAIVIAVGGIVAALIIFLKRMRRSGSAAIVSEHAPQTSPPHEETPAVAEGWELVKSFGAVRTVYMPHEYLKDKHIIAQALGHLVNKKETVQVMFFDDREQTPTGLPMTDEQTLHWRAKYNFNPSTEFERFVYIKITDPTTSPPITKEVVADVRPGYCE